MAKEKSFSEQWCCTWVVALKGDGSSAQDGVRWEAWSGGSATLQVQRRGQIVHGQICVPAFLALLCQLLPSLDAVRFLTQFHSKWQLRLIAVSSSLSITCRKIELPVVWTCCLFCVPHLEFNAVTKFFYCCWLASRCLGWSSWGSWFFSGGLLHTSRPNMVSFRARWSSDLCILARCWHSKLTTRVVWEAAVLLSKWPFFEHRGCCWWQITLMGFMFVVASAWLSYVSAHTFWDWRFFLMAMSHQEGGFVSLLILSLQQCWFFMQ